jgi:hypothetical protein
MRTRSIIKQWQRGYGRTELHFGTRQQAIRKTVKLAQSLRRTQRVASNKTQTLQGRWRTCN